MAEPPRIQCSKCPWKKSTDPHDIPNGYSESAHCALRSTIADPNEIRFGSIRMMACHETPVGAEKPCVGWLAHQLGPGNNLGLRMAAVMDRSLGNFELVGPQHRTFNATLPKRRCKARKEPSNG